MWLDVDYAVGPLIPLPDEVVAERYQDGLALLERGEPEQAREDLEAVTRLMPEFLPGWDALGRARAGAGDIEGAEQCFREAVRLDRGYWYSWYHWAQALRDAGRPAAALRVAASITRREPIARCVQFLRGRCQFDLGEVAKARRAFEAALGAREDEVADGMVLVQLAQVWADLEEFEEAEQCLQRACLVSPDDPQVFLCWAQVLSQRGDDEAAERMAKRAVALDRGSPAALLFLINLALEKSDWEKAEVGITGLEAVPETGRLPAALRAEAARRQGRGQAACRQALDALRMPAVELDAGVDRALAVLREERASLQRCRNYQLEIAGLLGEAAYYRAYSVLARDADAAVQRALEIERELTPGPWRIARLEEIEHAGEALEGVYWLSLNPAMLDRNEYDFEMEPSPYKDLVTDAGD